MECATTAPPPNCVTFDNVLFSQVDYHETWGQSDTLHALGVHRTSAQFIPIRRVTSKASARAHVALGLGGDDGRDLDVGAAAEPGGSRPHRSRDAAPVRAPLLPSLVEVLDNMAGHATSPSAIPAWPDPRAPGRERAYAQ
jgi:hypothetical protein